MAGIAAEGGTTILGLAKRAWDFPLRSALAGRMMTGL
jgi:hypothetical protein